MLWHDVEQNTDEWDYLRTGRVTASNFGAVMALDSDPVEDYIKNNCGTFDEINKAIYNLLNGKRLGSNQQKTVAFITEIAGINPKDDGCIHEKIRSYASTIELPKKPFGDQANDYALQIALEIINGKKSEFSFTNSHMERGHAQEPVARMMYEDENFVTVTNGGFFDCGDYGTSPDGLVGENGGIEIKSVVAKTHYATLKRGSFDPSYKWQLIGHLDCTGREWFDFVSFCSDFPPEKQLIVHRLYRDQYQDEITRLRERRSEFLELVRLTLESIKKRAA